MKLVAKLFDLLSQGGAGERPGRTRALTGAEPRDVVGFDHRPPNL
jgi:hypothetical protein